jgi:hypothetical protein
MVNVLDFLPGELSLKGELFLFHFRKEQQVKLKMLSLCLTKHYAMKEHGEVDIFS